MDQGFDVIMARGGLKGKVQLCFKSAQVELQISAL